MFSYDRRGGEHLTSASRKIGGFIGLFLALDVDDGLLVTAVEKDAPAAKAGLAAGDELVSAGGQPLISTADFQWVLHTSSADAKLPVTIRRGGKTLEKTIVLAGNWKERSNIAWRASSWYGLRQGLKVEPQNKLGWSNLASIAGRMGHHEKALTFAERAIAIDPKLVEAHLHRATAAKALGKVEIVRDACQHLSSIEPEKFRRAHT